MSRSFDCFSRDLVARGHAGSPACGPVDQRLDRLKRVTPFDPSLHSEERVVGPGFHSQVHDLVSEVPSGRVTTYGDIATALGSRRVARHVGFALAALPKGSEVPWWRVVAAGGKLSQGPAASAKQARLLRAEGLTIVKNRIRDFNEHRHDWTD